jgi:hypothetical protein
MRARTSRQTTELPLARAFGCALTAVLEPAQILSTVPGGIDVVIVLTCTVNILLRDFHAVAELRHCASWGCWQHHNLAHCSLFEATGCHASSCSMHHNASACMHYESCQESRVFGKCLLFWDLNPISNREIEFIKNMLRCSVFCTNH